MVKRLIIVLAVMAAVLGFTYTPANAATLWQETHCKGHPIGTKVGPPVVWLCVQTNYGYQADGDGLRINEVIFQVVEGCKYLERDGGGLVSGLHTSTFAGGTKFIPVDGQSFSPMFGCGPVTRVAGIRGPDTGRAYVTTNAHVRIDAANDWNPEFNYQICAFNNC